MPHSILAGLCVGCGAFPMVKTDKPLSRKLSFGPNALFCAPARVLLGSRTCGKTNSRRQR
jgi:hypothetical protein